MKKFLTFVLAALMLLSTALPVFADEPAAGLVLADGAHVVLDTEAGYVDKIDGTITVADLKAKFVGAVDVAGKADDAFAATDDIITAGDESIKVLIYGDVNRDGKIILGDATSMLKKIAGWDSDMNEIAADVDKTGAVNLSDVSKLLKFIAGWDDISLGNVRLIFENKKDTAEFEDSTLDLTFTNMMYKNDRTVQSYEDYATDSYKMKLAKNENESCQVILYSENEREGLSAELTPFVNEFGDATMESELQWVMYLDHNMAWPIITNDVTKEKGHWENTDDFVNWFEAVIPEALLDMADTFELKAGLIQHFVVTAHSTKDTPAGMYTATLNIKDGDKVIKTATVYAYVWDFTVPDTPYSASLFANAEYARKENGEWDTGDYYEMMLNNNISSYVIPYDLDDPRTEQYMNDPRVTAFVIGGGTTGPNDEYGKEMYAGRMDRSVTETVAYYNKVASNPEWAKKGLFYYADEPWGEQFFMIRDTYNYITELLGTTDIHNLVPFGPGYPNQEYQSKGIDSVEFLKDYINVWVPTSDAYLRAAEGGRWTPRYAQSLYGEYPDRIEEMRARGDYIWWYVCCSPEIPYANYFTWYQGVVVRLLSWQQYMNNVNGVLYYGIGVHWDKITKYKFDITNGDGVLAFPGELWGRVGPQESWRLYQIRDGFDDIDYLSMAEELVGREAVMKIVNKVTTGMLNYTEDYRVLDACRDEIAKIILENQGK